MDKNELFTDKEVITLLRKQRHDFINHVQVIYAYLQMNKQEKAEEYIDKLDIARPESGAELRALLDGAQRARED